jgi:acetylornithine/succinyldiaminopimelate/putrescine aminotransferase
MPFAAETNSDEAATGAPGKPRLLSVEDAKSLSLDQVTSLFREHHNPGQLHFMKLLGFHKVIVDQAEGMYYVDRDGRKILDFFGGLGSLGFGHNHPRIIAARRKFEEEKRHEIAMGFMSQYATALAYDLAQCSPGDLDMAFLGSTGSEAMEAALKLAEQAQGPERSRIIYAENSFHGKTMGALSVTDGPLYRSRFELLHNNLRVPFGDIEAIRRAIETDPSIGIVCLETIQGGGGIIEASPTFWQELRRLCDRHSVLWVADEVQCGMGRTGHFYAFERFGVVPDIAVLAKSLGGSMCPLAAMIAKRDIYMMAYGTPKTALIHGPSTFSGMGVTCCTGIEALNILYDEGLMENAATQGDYFLSRLKTIQQKYPKMIQDVRGCGFMIGLEFADISETLPFGLKQAVSLLDDKLKGSLCGFIGCLLLRDYNVLVGFTEYNRNVLRFEPPLICQRSHIDEFCDAFDNLLSRGIVRIVGDFMKGYASGA